MKKLCLFFRFLSCLAVVTATLHGAAGLTELGKPRMEVFPPHVYGGHSQVFQTVMDDDGVLYATNYGAVLAYDGERWERIRIPGAGFLYGIARLGEERLVVCGVNTIGILEPGESGRWAFRSLAPQLPGEEAEQLGELWDLFVVEEAIYVFSRRKMMRFDETGARTWSFETEEMIYGFWSGSAVYIQVLGDGLYRLEDEQPVKVSEAELFRRPGPRLILDRAEGLLVATLENGLWIREDGALRRFAGEAGPFLERAFVNRGLRLPDGRLALGTFERGVIILSREGQLERIIDDAAGLPGNSVTHLSLGRDGALWISLNNGLARVETDDRITLYDRDLGLPPVSVEGILRHKGTVYLNSNHGLYRLRAVPEPGPARWEPVSGIEGEVNAMTRHGEDLFLANRGRVVRHDGETSEVLWDDSGLLRDLHPMRSRPDHILVGGRIGLALLYRDSIGEWRQAGTVPNLEDHVYAIAESEDGSIWLGTVYTGVIRLQSDGTGEEWIPRLSIQRFGEEEGLPSLQHVLVREEKGTMLALTARGTARFDPETERFVPFSEPAGPQPPEGWAWDVMVEIPGLGNWGSVYPVEEADDFSLYFGVRDTGGAWHWMPPGIFDFIGGLLYLYQESQDKTVLWAGGWSGLMRWEPELGKGPGAAGAESGPVIREILLPGGTRAFAGAGEPDAFAFPHSRGNTLFRFAAPVHEPGVEVEYRSRLDPFDEKWTAWGPAPERGFTNLPAGEYTFRVEARTAAGPMEETATASFEVLPPWYQTPLAWGLYAIGGLAVISGGVRLRMAALRKENRLLEERVQERTAELAESEANLRVARDAAEQANEAKSRFLANMSHELRTPLNAIMGYAQILERDPRLDERNRERTRILNSSSQLLLHLINEVLDLSKIEAGRLEIHKGPVDLSRTLLSLIESFRPKAAQKGIHLAYEVDPAFPRAVLTDVRKIEQILFNLVGNAVKFTHEGEVRIDLSAVGSRICINITDTGPGIPEAERETVFEPFYQAAASGTATREPGTGLGLSICRRLVEALGGGIRCLGRPGGGTVFEVELPLETGEAGESPRAMERRLRGYRGRRLSLLVVDDVKENRNIISELLEPLGFTVKHAPDGPTALEQVRQGGIDLMLLDVRMSPMSGEELLRHLEKLPGGRSFPVVSYSASLIGFSREDAITMGCDDWLPKPFLPDDLFGKLETLLALEWEWEEEPEDTVVGDPEYRLSRDDLEQLRALAFRREPNGLKRLLGAILEREPDSAAVVEPLLKLLAGFRMAEISSVLDDLDSREEKA